MAVIKVTPLTDITSLIASDSVNEGDVLLLEEGIYFQTVNITKNNIRIVAKGPGVIFDGKSVLSIAFTIDGVDGVFIEGINIRYYRAVGITILSSPGNRIINNKINNILNRGLNLNSTSGNLIWRNEVCNCIDGIGLFSGSTNNWIIENKVSECFNMAYQTLASSDSNNAFISNTAVRNRIRGFDIFGSNNLVLNNLSINSVGGVVISSGRDSLSIGNVIKSAKYVWMLHQIHHVVSFEERVKYFEENMDKDSEK